MQGGVQYFTNPEPFERVYDLMLWWQGGQLEGLSIRMQVITWTYGGLRHFIATCGTVGKCIDLIDTVLGYRFAQSRIVCHPDTMLVMIRLLRLLLLGGSFTMPAHLLRSKLESPQVVEGFGV